jgi:HEAT repeat protein
MVTALLLLLLPSLQEEALDRFKQAYKNEDPNARAKAVQTLGVARGRKVLSLLGSHLRKDGAVVRMAAAGALGGYREESSKALSLLATGFGSNRRIPEVQASILDAMGELGNEKATRVVNRLFLEEKTVVADAAIRAAEKLRSKSSISPLINALVSLEKDAGISKGSTKTLGGSYIPNPGRTQGNRDDEERNRTLAKSVSTTLRALTGEKFKAGADWKAWWKKNGAKFKVVNK